MRPLVEVPVPPWTVDALCAQMPGDLWFPEKGANGTINSRVRALCAACPVQTQCLDTALANGERFGFWGGLSPEERKKLARQRHREAA